MGYEVLPAMTEESNGVWRDLAVVIGCIAGISLMIYVKTATAATHDEGGANDPLTPSQEVGHPQTHRVTAPVSHNALVPFVSSQYLRMFNSAATENGSEDAKPSIPDVEDVIPGENSGSGGDYGTSDKAQVNAGGVPWPIVLGIFFDTSMDGFLIGIVYAMSIHASFILTVSLKLLARSMRERLTPLPSDRCVHGAVLPGHDHGRNHSAVVSSEKNRDYPIPGRDDPADRHNRCRGVLRA